MQSPGYTAQAALAAPMMPVPAVRQPLLQPGLGFRPGGSVAAPPHSVMAAALPPPPAPIMVQPQVAPTQAIHTVPAPPMVQSWGAPAGAVGQAPPMTPLSAQFLPPSPWTPSVAAFPQQPQALLSRPPVALQGPMRNNVQSSSMPQRAGMPQGYLTSTTSSMADVNQDRQFDGLLDNSNYAASGGARNGDDSIEDWFDGQVNAIEEVRFLCEKRQGLLLELHRRGFGDEEIAEEFAQSSFTTRMSNARKVASRRGMPKSLSSGFGNADPYLEQAMLDQGRPGPTASRLAMLEADHLTLRQQVDELARGWD